MGNHSALQVSTSSSVKRDNIGTCLVRAGVVTIKYDTLVNWLAMYSAHNEPSRNATRYY